MKAILDNCKLSYDYVRNGQLIDRTAAALAKGKLVGWFQGRMEWGPRALGNRSILASPVAPYVLENLNVVSQAARTAPLVQRVHLRRRRRAIFSRAGDVGLHGIRVRGD